jgi:hypothetical protein
VPSWLSAMAPSPSSQMLPALPQVMAEVVSTDETVAVASDVNRRRESSDLDGAGVGAGVGAH